MYLKLSFSNIVNGVGASRPCGLRKETSPLLESCDVFINTDVRSPFRNAGLPRTVPSSDSFNTLLQFVNKNMVRRDRAVMQLFETLRYKPEGRGFDSQ